MPYSCARIIFFEKRYIVFASCMKILSSILRSHHIAYHLFIILFFSVNKKQPKLISVDRVERPKITSFTQKNLPITYFNTLSMK